MQESLYHVEKAHQNSYQKSFHVTKNIHTREFDEQVSQRKTIQSATNITDKKK